MKYAICGDEIQGKGKKLGDGKTICKDYENSSLMVQACDRCEKEYIATDMTKDDYGTFCLHCYEEEIRSGEYGDLMSWETWKECWKNDGEEPDDERMFAEWVQRVHEDLAELTESGRICGGNIILQVHPIASFRASIIIPIFDN